MKRMLAWVVVVWLSMLPAVWLGRARADVVAAVDRPMTVGVKIVAVADGVLFYRLPAGREVSRPIEQIRYLQVTGWDDFNDIEKQYRDGRFSSAADGYEKLLAGFEASAARQKASAKELDRALLVRCRLLQVYNVEGRFDEGVRIYLDLIEEMPAILEGLRPAKLPAVGSTFLPGAVEAVERSIQRHRGTAMGHSLAAWLETWPGQQKAGDTAGGMAANETGANRQVRVQLDEAAKLIVEARFDEALRKLRPLANGSAGALRADVFYWQGRALLGKSLETGAAAGDRDHRRAGLRFMRVAIHFPGHPLAAESLWRAGVVCEQSGWKDLAAGLFAELVRMYPNAKPFSQRANDWLQSQSLRTQSFQ